MATLKNVAQLAGVGLGTASRVVTGNGAVAPKTREKVQKAIDALGFQPSHAARSLMLGNSQTIGVYIPYLSGTFHTPILARIYAELRAAKLNMVVAFGSGKVDDRNEVMDGIEFLTQRGSDGVIVLSNKLDDSDIAALGERAARLVVLNDSLAPIAERCFTVDHATGGRLAARRIVELGHRDIAVITGPRDSPDNVERITGLLNELTDQGIDVDSLWVAESDFSPEGGRATTEQLIASGYPFTALFCANDDMAIGALSALLRAGIPVPQQVSVLGYDDTYGGEFAAPRLSSVHMPWAEMTNNGLNCLLNLCYGGERPTDTTCEVTVTMRDSLGPVPEYKGQE